MHLTKSKSPNKVKVVCMNGPLQGKVVEVDKGLKSVYLSTENKDSHSAYVYERATCGEFVYSGKVG